MSGQWHSTFGGRALLASSLLSFVFAPAACGSSDQDNTAGGPGLTAGAGGSSGTSASGGSSPSDSSGGSSGKGGSAGKGGASAPCGDVGESCCVDDRCTVGLRCDAGTCHASKGTRGTATSCLSDADCVSGWACDQYRCVSEWAEWKMPGSSDAAFSYERVGDDIIRDKVTGLEWERVVPEKATWWPGAESRCRDLDLGGKSDWRLPRRVELMSLVNDQGPEAIDPTFFPDTPSAHFWSATPVFSPPGFEWLEGRAWRVSFAAGREDDIRDKKETAQVRCVR